MGTVNVLTAAEILRLLGQDIIDATVVGNDLILTTRNGTQINAGNVRGASASNPTAAATAFSPTAGILATNVQAAIAELANDTIALSSSKADIADVPKVLAGSVTQPSTANQKITNEFTNVFPSGFFSSAPNVVITPVSTVPENILYYSVTGITTRSFSIVSCRTTSSSTGYRYIAMGS